MASRMVLRACESLGGNRYPRKTITSASLMVSDARDQSLLRSLFARCCLLPPGVHMHRGSSGRAWTAYSVFVDDLNGGSAPASVRCQSILPWGFTSTGMSAE